MVYIVNVVFGKDIGIGVGEMADAHVDSFVFLTAPLALRLDMALLHSLKQMSTVKSTMRQNSFRCKSRGILKTTKPLSHVGLQYTYSKETILKMRKRPKVIYTSQLREHIARLVVEANAPLTKKEIDRINNAFKESGAYEIAVGVNKKLQDMEQIAYKAKIDPRSYWTSIHHRTTIQPSYRDDVIRKKASDYIDSINWNPSGTIPSPGDIVSAYYQFTQ